jgi:integrase
MTRLAENLIRDYRINHRASISDVESRWKLHLRPVFGALLPSQITSDLLDKYVDQRLKAGAANATINRELAALKRMLNLGYNATPPRVYFIPRFPRLYEDNVRKGFLRDEQYRRLLIFCSESWFQALVEAAYTYGWRLGELLSLKVDQVDLLRQTIRLHSGMTKNREGREVTMTRSIRRLFAQCVAGKFGKELVFTRSNGKAVRDCRRMWNNACVSAGVPDLLFHDLRRTAARNLRQAGVAEGIIMKIAGWQTRSVFERYAIVSQTDIQEALQKLEKQRSHSVKIATMQKR